MKLRRVRYGSDARTCVAVQAGDRWVPLVPALQRHGSKDDALSAAAHDLVALLAAPDLRERVAKLVESVAGEDLGPVDSAPLLPFQPLSFRDFSLWERHMIDAARGLTRFMPPPVERAVGTYERVSRRPFPRLKPGAIWYQHPIYYKGNHRSFIADGEVVPWPSYTQALDYELELGLVIASSVRDATPEEGQAAIGGFVLVNDFSARDVQYPEMSQGLFGPAKSKDFANGLGAVVVTADEVLHAIGALAAEVRVNGDVWGRGTTSGMQHSLGEMVAYASRGEQVSPGDLLATGTLPGCSGVEIDRWLSPGDEVELQLERVGTLRNTIGQPQPFRMLGPVGRARWTVVPRAGREPVPTIDPGAWAAPPAPEFTGVLEPNHVLDRAERWETPGGIGPEDVVVDADGRVHTGVEDGRILRFPAGGGTPEVVADTHARPLGLELDADGRLVICDAERGLLRAGMDGTMETLVDRYEGRPLRFTNNAAIATDGTIYFSDSSTRFPIAYYRWDLLEHRGNGRVFAFDPATGDLRLLLDGLYFANGVTMAPDESYLLVAETGRYRITRLWLAGERQGQREVFTTNLPGFPDNASTGPSGIFWVAIASPRNPRLDATLPRPGVRRLIARLPERLQPQPEHYGLVVGLDADGTIRHALHGPSGSFSEVTGVREHDGWLYLGSLIESAIARVPFTP